MVGTKSPDKVLFLLIAPMDNGSGFFFIPCSSMAINVPFIVHVLDGMGSYVSSNLHVYEVLFENEWNYVEVTCASLNCEYIENFLICSN